MAIIDNPVFKKAIDEQVRPMAERARGLFILAKASAPALTEMLGELSEAADSDIVDDHRLGEGVQPLTVGELRAAAGLLSDLVTQIEADPRLPAVLGACVRELQVS